jgi:hypothetical protein
MPAAIPRPTPIYHITHVDNLPRIIADGGLRCCADLRRNSVAYRDIAFGHIQDRRARTVVTCGPRGSLQEYVPFYFGPRSPMLYTISRGNVASYQEGQGSVVHLVSNVQAVQAASLPSVFTDGHATMMMSDFYDDLARLDQVDWPLMQARDWFDIPAYPDRKRRRQAEFLVHRSFPWDLVTAIGVVSQSMRQRTEAVLGASLHRPVVEVRRGWYY